MGGLVGLPHCMINYQNLLTRSDKTPPNFCSNWSDDISLNAPGASSGVTKTTLETVFGGMRTISSISEQINKESFTVDVLPVFHQKRWRIVKI